MEEMGLPERLFESGFEPTGRKRVHSYFTLRWVELIKPAIDPDYIDMLSQSQFKSLMKMGDHTFSVMFVHYLLSRQLVTKKKYELWWLFSGKPVRYGIDEFAIVTGLNCEEPDVTICKIAKKSKAIKGRKKKVNVGKERGPMWVELFGESVDPTVSWILDRRESFIMSVESAKARTASQYAQSTTAIQGFVHAIVLVAACSCPEIVKYEAAEDSSSADEESIEHVVKFVVDSRLSVRSTLSDSISGSISKSVFDDEQDDPQVLHMLALINEDFPFEHNSWRGGVKACEAVETKVIDSNDGYAEVEVSTEIYTAHAPCLSKVVNPSTMCTAVADDRLGKHFGKLKDNGDRVECVDVSAQLKNLADAYEDRTAEMLRGVSASFEFVAHVIDKISKVETIFENDCGKTFY
ncbi:unnamed protein product [Microthlaspi erraticum]|uniref:DUF1985 domain-containing protein n=1 Tax=Microthlaspi erraticum TaxID=1685480 RepID=A0A6D2JWS8_9BRAS|nr:unnamed protein product [Microthlaspi erraticum]